MLEGGGSGSIDPFREYRVVLCTHHSLLKSLHKPNTSIMGSKNSTHSILLFGVGPWCLLLAHSGSKLPFLGLLTGGTKTILIVQKYFIIASRYTLFLIFNKRGRQTFWKFI